MSKVSWTRESGTQRRRMPSKRAVTSAVLVIVAVILLIIGFLFFRGGSEVERVLINAEPEKQADEAPPKPEAVEGRYLFNGTLVLARAVEREAGNDLTQPFSKLDTFNPGQYDTMTLDWECPSTDDVIPYATQVSNLLFNCHTKWLPEVSKHFGIVSLANNHSNDLGAEAFVTTQQNLNKAGIQTYGSYDPTEEKDACEIIALPVRVQMPDDSEEEGRLPMAFCAWHYFFRTPKTGEMEVMERFAKVMPVFGFMHAGAEYRTPAAPDQEAIAHKIIDMGAEFVIGNSPHWVQNGEVYKGKPIFYSTGNFIFDQIDYETMRGLSIDVSMKVPYSDNVAKWLALGKECKALHDGCIDKAVEQGLKKFDLELTYDVVGSSGGARRITQKADTVLQKAIEERVGWDQMKAKLEQ